MRATAAVNGNGVGGMGMGGFNMVLNGARGGHGGLKIGSSKI